MAKTGAPLLDIAVSPATARDELGIGAGADAPAAAEAGAGAGAAAGGEGGSATPAHLRGLATPAVRRIAREHGIAISDIPGSGKDGRVTKDDILRHVEGGGTEGGAAAAASAAAPRAAAASSASAAVAPAAAPSGAAPLPPLPLPSAKEGLIGADQRVPIRGLQRAMVRSMTAAWAVPHFG
jgi:pyruvate/2-oxoglutarate dehydrogenase complex dihydrolipoamide acyltransferase (E2) component